ncbi:MAG: hypothetical protein KUG67_02670 [Proteobacteria bacterium]|nr:hypothetical protein [Pseudomonadota bacterium]
MDKATTKKELLDYMYSIPRDKESIIVKVYFKEGMKIIHGEKSRMFEMDFQDLDRYPIHDRNFMKEHLPDDSPSPVFVFAGFNEHFYSVLQWTKEKVPSQLPGPPQWNGPEGGCLGLPTDVAKLILKWV